MRSHKTYFTEMCNCQITVQIRQFKSDEVDSL